MAPNCCSITVPGLLIPQILGAIGVSVCMCVFGASGFSAVHREGIDAGDVLEAVGSLLLIAAEWGKQKLKHRCLFF